MNKVDRSSARWLGGQGEPRVAASVALHTTLPVGLSSGAIQFVLAKSRRSSVDNLNLK